MDNINIDINVIKDYLANSKDEIELKCFLRLYSNYSKINGFSFQELNNLEDETYTIEGKILSNKERISKEIVIIKSKLNKCRNTKIFEYASEKLQEIEAVLSHDENVFKEYVPYLKKTISELQAILDLNICFYNDSYKGFKEKYNALLEEAENIKKGKILGDK